MVQPITGIVIMGTSGCGKSTLGGRLADALGCRFVEGDDLHPAENVAKMAGGQALNDDDRWPWLKRVAGELGNPGEAGCVVSCSALKRVYRDFIRGCAGDPVLFVFPQVDATTLHDRLHRRPNHYMPPSLLQSQLATLEGPQMDEPVLELDGTQPVETLVASVLHYLSTLSPNRDILAPGQDAFGQAPTSSRPTNDIIPGMNR